MAAQYLPGAATCCCLGNLDISWRAISDRLLDRRIISDRAPSFCMAGMAA